MLHLVLFCPGGHLGILFCKDAYDTSRDFVMDYGFVVFSNDINTEFLSKKYELQGSGIERAG